MWGPIMRAIGLLSLLSGSVILLLPVFSALLDRRLTFTDDSLIGGALLCLGVAALAIARNRTT